MKNKEEFFPKQDWQYDVTNGDTVLGYVDWVAHNFESWQEGLIALAYRAIEVGNTEAAAVALIEAEYGVETEEEAKDIVTLAGNRF
jgi:hypothetical protein